MANLTLATAYSRTTRRAYSTPDYTSAEWLVDAHLITQDIWSDIIYERKGNRNWDIWLADTVSLQDEYTKPTPASITVGADYIESVSVTYESDTYENTGSLVYKPCREATTEEQKDWIRLLEEQDRDNPIYFESDGSIFIAPEIRTGESGTNRIRITGVRSIASGAWTTSTSETDIKLPIFFFEVLVYGCIWKAQEFDRRDDVKIAQAYNVYLREKRLAIKKLNIEKSEIMATRRVESDDIIITTE